MKNLLYPILLFQLLLTNVSSQTLPNIIWIVSEDNSPYLGCYGDTLATTPNIDQLASEGMIYSRAFSNAPVCAPARHTIITGTYANGNGTENMRSSYPIDSLIRFFPAYLKDKGYYTTNRRKKDYNTIDQPSVWNESGKHAHYNNRVKGQPFFHVVNFIRSHESSIHGTRDDLIHNPAQMQLPPYHPDTEEIRKDWAWYYDRITQMDALVGEVIEELKAEGLYEETIIFYYSDHGGVLGRSKRYLYDSGQHIPFIVRVPEKYQSLFPDYAPQTVNKRLISFVDLAPTLLSVANIKHPKYLDGKAFNKKNKQRKYVYGYASRMDSKLDMSRSVRDEQYLYIRHFFPERPNGYKNQYQFRQATMQSWQKACENGNCNSYQADFWKPKPVIELFDCDADPHNVHSLHNNPAYVKHQKRLDQALTKWMVAQRDKAIIHELDRQTLIQKAAIDQWTDKEYRDLLAFVFKITAHAPFTETQLLTALNKNIHYQNWALHYLIQHNEVMSERLIEKLSQLANSEAVSVKMKAAVLLLDTPNQAMGKAIINELLHTNDEYVQLYTLDLLQFISPAQRPSFNARIQEIASSEQAKRYNVRMATHLLELFE